MKTEIYYDGDCPFCAQYTRLLTLKKSAGEVVLVSLRDDERKRRELERRGYDLDNGMVVIQGSEVFYGQDAIHRLALMTTPSGVFNRLTAAVFSNRLVSRLAYPLMRAGRTAAITLLGKESFRPWDPGEKASFEIAGRLFGFFAALHALLYFFHYNPGVMHVSLALTFLLGFILIVQPTSVRVFILLVVAMVVDSWLQAPVSSNHTILQNFWLLAVGLGGIWFWLKGRGFEEFFRSARPIGQSLLMVMYFYGIFHKLNTDFLDPEVSCAVELLRAMPVPLSSIDYPWFYQLGIYGTFVAEGLIMLALFFPKTRHLGVVSGIGFHSLLAMSGYAAYAVFSTLTIFLHSLFLSPVGALAVTGSRPWLFFNRVMRRPVFITLLLLAFGLMGLIALVQDYISVSLLWMAALIPVFFCILVYGDRGGANTPFLWSPTAWLNIVTVAFFVNGALPYAGLKTEQTINMFANLRLEGGMSNHLLFPDPPRLFGYLSDVARVHEADSELKMGFFTNRADNLIVYYDLLNRMEKARDAKVSYTRNGVLYQAVSYEDVQEEAQRILHSRAFRKYFHFRWVRDSDKITCDASAPWQRPAVL